jgi:predicted phosphodiesterase
MRAIILSDIHANFEALKKLGSAVQDADLRICLGDVIGYYCQVNEVVDFVRRYDFLCIRGNHDDFLTAGCPAGASDAVRFGIEYADRIIDPDHRRWLAGLPLIWGGFLGGESSDDRCSVLLCHGSPWQPLRDYIYADSPLLPQLEHFSFDLIAFGQTHRPIAIDHGSRTLLNPGSVGQSRHRYAVACAASLDISSRPCISMIETAYDTGPVIRMAIQAGAGDWIRKHLVSDS